jgi:hypothetical protein
MANSTINISFDLLGLQGAKRITGKDGKEYVAICIPESRINAHANGKCYLSLDVKSNRDGEDKFGKTHSVSEQTTKEERLAKQWRPFIGSGKEFVFDGAPRSSAPKSSTPAKEHPLMQDDDNTEIPW